MTYHVRYVHKISPRDSDTIPEVELPDGAFADRRTLGAALRKARVMCAGRVGSFRVEGARVVVFPVGSIWHSVILTANE